MSAIIPGLSSMYAGKAGSVISRGVRATKSTNLWIVISGFFEPVFYLLSMGIGLGALVGEVESSGKLVPYAAFIAPALLAVSGMNGAIYDSTMNVFFKLNYGKIYQTMLTTSLGPLDVALGEIFLALLRGGLYATGFLGVMQLFGLNLSWTAILAIPAVIIIAFGFASIGMGITSYMTRFQQLDLIQFFLLPMFLFSATFYPLSVYPGGVQVFIQALPLWHGVELIRALTLGTFNAGHLWHLLYFVMMIIVGLIFTSRRLKKLFQD